MTSLRDTPGPILLFGGGGLLGQALVPELEGRGIEVTAPFRSQVDVADATAVRQAVERAGPRWVVNLAAYTDVNGAESHPTEAFRLNRDAATLLAEAAADAGARSLFLSTDYVFDGRARAPYAPQAPTSPLSVYGRSKAEGEEGVLASGRNALVVRTSWLYGTGGKNFVDTILARGREVAGGRDPGPLKVVDDQRGRPTWTRSLARGLAELMAAEAAGVVHLADGGDATWYELAEAVLRLAGVPAEVERTATRPAPGIAARPAYSLLDLGETERLLGHAVPHWTESLEHHLKEAQ